MLSKEETAMPEKKPFNMLIKAIPTDVWERIDMLCRRRGIKRREFLKQALTFFEGGADRKGYDQAAEKARQAKQQVDQIMEALKGYDGLLTLRRR